MRKPDRAGLYRHRPPARTLAQARGLLWRVDGDETVVMRASDRQVAVLDGLTALVWAQAGRAGEPPAKDDVITGLVGADVSSEPGTRRLAPVVDRTGPGRFDPGGDGSEVALVEVAIDALVSAGLLVDQEVAVESAAALRDRKSVV